MICFVKASSQDIKNNPKAIEYLQSGSGIFGGLNQAYEGSNRGYGQFFLVKRDTDLIGAIYLTFTHQDIGKVMTSVLLAGDEFSSWAEELRTFYYQLAKENECDEFMLMGRKGFKRYFPELEEAATIFHVNLIRPF